MNFLPHETEEERLALIIKDLTLSALTVDISRLTRYSSTKVYIRCIVCGKPKLARYTGLLKKQGLTCIGECNHILRSSVQTINNPLNEQLKEKRRLGIIAFNQDPEKVAKKNTKREQTTLVKYGVKNATQNAMIQEKMSIGLKKAYKENPEMLEKRCTTNLERYGVTNFLISKQMQKANQEKYGTNYRLQSLSEQEKTKTIREQVLFEKYGVINASQSEELVKRRINSLCKNRLAKGKNYSKEFWLNQTYGYNCVLDPTQVLPESWGPGTDHKFILICGVENCGRRWSPTWYDVMAGNTKTCGCLVGVSVAEMQVYEYVKQLCNDAIHTYKINNIEVDIFIPSKNIAIEYNGLFWHRAEIRQKQDAEKAKKLKELGIRYIGIFEDEWLQREEMIKDYLIMACGKKKKTQQLRPQQVQVVYSKNTAEIRCFLQKHHYGGGNSPLSQVWSIYYESRLIGVLGCGNPTRHQIKENIELKRICLHPDYHVPGIWSFVFKNYVSKFYPKGTSITSFSDNRRDTGKLYQVLGFVEAGQIYPDYYWCKNQQRFHKAKFQNVTKIQTELTENEYMMAQGYFKIFDCGKTKWSITL